MQRTVLLVASLASALCAQAPVAFETGVLPILKEHCFECHRGEHTDGNGRVRKPKGGLRLDGRSWILMGGKEGNVLTPGKPEQSPLYTRVVLPADHDERMPANGDPLGKEQSETLRGWIAAGADFGGWQGEALAAPSSAGSSESGAAAPAPVVAAVQAPVESSRSKLLAEVAGSLSPAPAGLVTKVAGDKARIEPVADGSPLLRVEFPGREDDVTDEDLAALAPLKEHIAYLGLGRTKITDVGCSAIGRMPRLLRLDLRETKVGDAGLGKLVGLKELRTLNLFSTEISDAGVTSILRLPKLTELRVYETAITEAGLGKLRQGRGELNVVGAPELPGASTATPTRQGRRR